MMDKIIGSVSKPSKLPYLGSILLKLRLHVPLLGKIGIPRNQEIRVRVKKFPKQILLIFKFVNGNRHADHGERAAWFESEFSVSVIHHHAIDKRQMDLFLPAKFS